MALARLASIVSGAPVLMYNTYAVAALPAARVGPEGPPALCAVYQATKKVVLPLRFFDFVVFTRAANSDWVIPAHALAIFKFSEKRSLMAYSPFLL